MCGTRSNSGRKYLSCPGTISSRANERAISAQENSNAIGNFCSSICVKLAIFSDEELTVPKATILGVAKEISDILVDKINSKKI